jgi:DNA-binding CsgD family transcriptional regulator
MLVSEDITARSHRMIAACGLDSLSIFLSARAADGDGLTYLFNHGVSQDAQHAYKDGRVFADDPFPGVMREAGRCGELIRWGDARLLRAADDAREYRHFINCHSVEVVGAWVQQFLPGFFLVIGAHCRPGGHRSSDVCHGLLQHEAGAISQMVVSQLLEETLAAAGGRMMFRSILDTAGDGACAGGDAGASLSSRELEIARLISTGKQNKQVAYLTGISEFTVENHLRRIYRKLGVHNRAAMTAKLFGGLTCQ